MIDYLIGLGDNVIIEYPQILKDGYLEKVNKILNYYKSSNIWKSETEIEKNRVKVWYNINKKNPQKFLVSHIPIPRLQCIL